MTLVPIILAGGAGTRLWPLSRAEHPKAFVDLLGTGCPIDRALKPDLFHESTPIVVGHEDHRFLIAEAARRVGVQVRILLEPARRGSGVGAIAGACLARIDDPEAVVAILRADRPLLPTVDEFRDAAQKSQDGSWVRLECDDGRRIDVVQAQELLDRAGALGPEVLEIVESRSHDLGFERVPSDRWSALSSLNIESLCAPMQVHRLPTDQRLTPRNLDELYHQLVHDADENALSGHAFARGARGCLVAAQERLVVALEVDDLAIIDTPDAVLVTRRQRAEQVRDLVRELRRAGLPQAQVHRKVFRPWGCYEVIDQGLGYRVKLIQVLPGQALSLQRHAHRAEHWVVVAGRAWATIEERELTIETNGSALVPIGAAHRLENRSEERLVVVEVQTGEILDEEDIERLDDRYGRSD
ncbi:MAG: cupin domain-containing protein [Deltaproteobacteria bacterium]|nr:MAG: cupin domain-containing protein [Deltaproteobacteria bacterium]